MSWNRSSRQARRLATERGDECSESSRDAACCRWPLRQFIAEHFTGISGRSRNTTGCRATPPACGGTQAPSVPRAAGMRHAAGGGVTTPCGGYWNSPISLNPRGRIHNAATTASVVLRLIFHKNLAYKQNEIYELNHLSKFERQPINNWESASQILRSGLYNFESLSFSKFERRYFS